MKRARFIRRAGLNRPHAGGRWHRILTALNGQPMTTDQLFAATDPQKHPEPLERRKIKVALRDLAALGLIDKAAGWGWASTADGRRTLTDMEDQAVSVRTGAVAGTDLRVAT